MNQPIPPVLMSSLLNLLLPARDSHTVAGDLAEAYADQHAKTGESAADFWYARQVFSMIPRAFVAAYMRTPVLALSCCFTLACAVWLGTMDALLGHHDLLLHESIAGLIAGQSLLTLLTLPLARLVPLRWAASFGAAATTWLGVSAWINTLHSRDTEGYILLISLALVVQALMTWRVMFTHRLRTSA